MTESHHLHTNIRPSFSSTRGEVLTPLDLSPKDTRLSCDVVVIGSGAGGATVAATVAENGKNVLLIEEGPGYKSTEYSGNFSGMTSEIMRHGGATVIMGRSPIAYLEGRVLGGSTVLNGGMCWRTPEEVLNEWSQRGLERLNPKSMSPYFDLVEEVIQARYQNVGSEGENNHIFRRGVESMGWDLQRNKRNQVHCVGTNDCVTGCPTGAKQSTVLTWIPRLLEAGGHVLTYATATKIKHKNNKVTGVEVKLSNTLKNRNIFIEAKEVVVACGAVQTPLLIQRSKLFRNPHIGRHFTIHPNAKVAALFDHPVESMRGVHQAWQCTEFKRDGILMAPGGVPLSVISQCFPLMGADLTEQMRLAPYIATAGVLVDDSRSGRIKAGPFGIDLIKYDVNDYDQERFIRGVQHLSQIFFAAGARRVYTPFEEVPTLDHPEQVRRLADVSPKVEHTEYFTAHLMGTCRMSATRDQGVVKPTGESWDLSGLYIADASVMPGTIGVNPQVTIMALARLIGESIASKS
jgi:choline dehydrogenase-like flavoprotein